MSARRLPAVTIRGRWSSPVGIVDKHKQPTAGTKVDRDRRLLRATLLGAE
jgi:hypothetical protein